LRLILGATVGSMISTMILYLQMGRQLRPQAQW
jgi:hypothetical protein